MELIVRPEIWERFPAMTIVVALASGIDNSVERPAVAGLWREAWEGAASANEYGNAQSHPRIRPWREHFRAIGVSQKTYPSSIEALLRRAMKGGEPFSINPLVDFYNAVSLRHVVPVGAFDLAGLSGLIELRLTREGDTFHALDADALIPVEPNEVAYTDGTTVLTRHFMWRQSREGLIAPATREALLVSEIAGEVGREVAHAVLADLVTGCSTGFRADVRSVILDAGNPAVSW